jgi:hypothetical protein
MNSVFKKYICVFFIAVFSVFLFPRELVHDLHHQDTEDIQYDHDGSPSIDHQHHHCKSLLLICPDLPGLAEAGIQKNSYLQLDEVSNLIKEQFVFFLCEFSRGPPAIIQRTT